MYFDECKTQEEKQNQMEHYIEAMYLHLVNQSGILSEINAKLTTVVDKVNATHTKLNYVGATEDERQFLNNDGTLNVESVNKLCDDILEEFKTDEMEGTDNGERI